MRVSMPREVASGNGQTIATEYVSTGKVTGSQNASATTYSICVLRSSYQAKRSWFRKITICRNSS